MGKNSPKNSPHHDDIQELVDMTFNEPHMPKYLEEGVHVMPSMEQEEKHARGSWIPKLALFTLFFWGVLIGYQNVDSGISTRMYKKLRTGVNHAKARITGQSLDQVWGQPTGTTTAENDAATFPGKSRKSVAVASNRKPQYVQDPRQDSQVHSFFGALRSGDISRMRALLNTGWVRVNTARYKGFTPLEMATWMGNVDVVKFLLHEQKADPNIRDAYGTTALYYTSQSKKNRSAITKLLVQAGAKSTSFRTARNGT